LVLAVEEFLVFNPFGFKIGTEDCHENLIAVVTVTIDVSFADTFLVVSAFFETTLASGVEVVNHRADLAQVEGVEGVLEYEHLGLSAVTFVPVLFVANKRAGSGGPMLVIDVVKAHHTDDLI